MRYKNTLEAISISLDDVQRLILELGDEGRISTIDLDLAADKIRHIYDLMLSIRNEYPNYKLVAEKVKVPEKLEKVPDTKPLVVEPEAEIIQPSKFEAITQNEPAKTVLPSPAIIEAERSPIPTAKANEEKRFIGDSFQQGKITVADELAEKKQQNAITDKLKAKPISSISGAIGLNEKFELLQNLFHGNKEKYDVALNTLNIAANFNEACEYLSGTLQFDLENEYVKRLLELVRRKLMVQ